MDGHGNEPPFFLILHLC